VAVGQWQEDERKKAEERYRTLVDAIPQIVWIASPGGTLEYVNQRMADYLGLTVEQVLGAYSAGWREFVHPDDRPGSEEKWQQAQKTGTVYEAEYRVLNKNGHYRWHLSRGLPVRNASGEIVQWFGTLTDIDDRQKEKEERERLLEQLRQSEKLHRLLADLIPHSVWIASPDGTLEYVNQRTADYLGLTVEQVLAWLGGSRRDAVHPDDRAHYEECWTRAREKGEKYEIEYRLRNSKGEYRWHLGRGLPQTDSAGKVVKWFGTCTDIEDSKRPERSTVAQQE
jgi:PAS domain S-box-containing protein